MLEWLIYRGLKIGLSYEQVFNVPYGELMDLIAIDMIANGAEEKKTQEEETEEFMELLSFR